MSFLLLAAHDPPDRSTLVGRFEEWMLPHRKRLAWYQRFYQEVGPALVTHRELVRDHPADATTWGHLALLEAMAGNPDRSREALRSQSRLLPGNKDLHEELAERYLASRRPGEAAEELERAGFGPDRVRQAILRSCALAGRWEEALAAASRRYGTSGDSPEAALELVEILLARWIHSEEGERIQIGTLPRSLKRIWLGIFEFMGHLSYRLADRITTLFEGNGKLQVHFGADPAKLEVIPNGVDLTEYSPGRRHLDPIHPRVALVGRVVAIKDLRTFLRACRGVLDQRPDVSFEIIGPTEESPEYHAKYLEFSRLLGLEKSVTFTGNVPVREHYPGIDVVVLSSISEGLPLSLLEAMACGIPCVATRVGACPELLEGRGSQDRAIGAAGLLTEVQDHQAMAQAILSILEDPDLASRLGHAGRERVTRFYDAARVRDRYRTLYSDLLALRPEVV